MASGVYTATLWQNCARSMKLKMMVSSWRIRELRMFVSDRAELMSREFADAGCVAAVCTAGNAWR